MKMRSKKLIIAAVVVTLLGGSLWLSGNSSLFQGKLTSFNKKSTLVKKNLPTLGSTATPLKAPRVTRTPAPNNATPPSAPQEPAQSYELPAVVDVAGSFVPNEAVLIQLSAASRSVVPLPAGDSWAILVSQQGGPIIASTATDGEVGLNGTTYQITQIRGSKRYTLTAPLPAGNYSAELYNGNSRLATADFRALDPRTFSLEFASSQVTPGTRATAYVKDASGNHKLLPAGSYGLDLRQASGEQYIVRTNNADLAGARNPDGSLIEAMREDPTNGSYNFSAPTQAGSYVLQLTADGRWLGEVELDVARPKETSEKK